MQQTQELPRITKAQTLDELAYLHIKDAILNGVFRPGEFLAEVQLAQKLGISKTPIRKALGRLQQERFLHNIPFEGYYVAEISIEDTLEIYQLRHVLECYLLEQTAEDFTVDELDELEAVLNQATRALDSGDYAGFIACNRTFHHAFDRKFGNTRISEMLTNLDEHVQRILMNQYSGEFEAAGASHAEHFQILAAMRARDTARAVASLSTHLDHFRDVLIARLRNSQ